MESVHQRTLEKKKGYHPADGYLFEYDRVAHQKPTASFDEHLLADLERDGDSDGCRRELRLAH